MNEIRDETREVASTVADTRTTQKIKRKDLPISTKSGTRITPDYRRWSLVDGSAYRTGQVG